jgi:hypothetical protein
MRENAIRSKTPSRFSRFRCHPERILAPRLRGKSKSSDPCFFTRLIGFSWLSH